MTAPGPHPGHRLAWCLLALAVAVSCVALAVFFTDRFAGWRVPAAYLLLLAAVAVLPLSAALAARGPGHAPVGPLAAGVVFVAGGAAFDVGATLWHTPDLAREGNPVARALLDSGHSVGFVLTAGMVGQLGFTAGLCCCWAGLLRHRRLILADMPAGGALLPTLKAATGGADRTWRQWLLPLRYDELPDAYHLCWAAVAVAVAGSALRWYIGLGWFGLVPPARLVGPAVACIACAAGLAAYVLWLSSAARRYPVSGPAEPSAADGTSDVKSRQP